MFDVVELPWLAPQEGETAALLKNRGALGELDLKALGTIARQRLKDSERRAIAKAAAGKAARAAEQGFGCVRVCIASQTTSDFIGEEIVTAALRFGLAVEFHEAQYNQLASLAFGNYFEEAPHRKFDYVFIALDYRQLGFSPEFVGHESDASGELERKLVFVRQIIAGIRNNAGTGCIVQNLTQRTEDWIASLDGRLPGSSQWYVENFNRALPAIVADCGGFVFDVNRLAQEVGLSRWHAPGLWYMAKIGISPEATPLYAHRFAALLAAARGRAKRVLVLDLDNTLWSGVIGDDGVEGIKIGPGSPVGEALLDLQFFALRLKARGIVLAVSSKNEEKIAKEPFESHPGMALKLTDFAVFRANWEDKASNIRHIAKILDLGLDSFVFIDDNPAERAIVRRTLPEICVPELPKDPAEYSRTVAAAGFFESVSFSTEDKARNQMYLANAKRRQAMEIVADLNSYLESLNMRMKIQPFDEPGRARIVQLINKSNQFNLTTRRYSATDVEAMEKDPEFFTLQASLQDSFGDNGMICVVICRSVGGAWEIDTWLMSCRVLKRRVEEQILQYLLDNAERAGVSHLVGVYKRTPRNDLVADHYRNLGFEKERVDDDGAEIWRLNIRLAQQKRKKLPFTLK